jgi:hypothetical protein
MKHDTTMTAHEFAQTLLNGPDLPVTIAGYGPYWHPEVTQVTLPVSDGRMDVLVLGRIEELKDEAV